MILWWMSRHSRHVVGVLMKLSLFNFFNHAFSTGIFVAGTPEMRTVVPLYRFQDGTWDDGSFRTIEIRLCLSQHSIHMNRNILRRRFHRICYLDHFLPPRIHNLRTSEGLAWAFAVRGRKGGHRRRQLIA